MESRLVLDVFRLSPSGERLEGEVDCVDLDEELVKPAGAARYRLEAKLYGTELLCGDLTPEEAKLLYIAVSTDSGCFCYGNTKADTLRAAAHLIDNDFSSRRETQ